MIWLLCILGAYLIGSIPFGVMIGKARGIDIRQHGSRNIGATNVGRVLGKPLGALCFALDVIKGAAPVLIAGLVTGTLGRPATAMRAGAAEPLTQVDMSLWLAVAAAAVLGHMFSIFLRFRGGKGVATGFGAMAAMWPVLTFPALGALVVWYATLRITKYVSIASILATGTLPIGYLLSVIPRDAQLHPAEHTVQQVLHAWPPLLGTALIALLVIWRHRSNITRIRRGEEPKAGER